MASKLTPAEIAEIKRLAAEATSAHVILCCAQNGVGGYTSSSASYYHAATVADKALVDYLKSL
jgi:hypothetical protein